MFSCMLVCSVAVLLLIIWVLDVCLTKAESPWTLTETTMAILAIIYYQLAQYVLFPVHAIVNMHSSAWNM